MKIVLAVLVSVCMFGFVAAAIAADPVDLGGKKGVINPNDLKKADPKSPKVQGNPPPPPPSALPKCQCVEWGPGCRGLGVMQKCVPICMRYAPHPCEP